MAEGKRDIHARHEPVIVTAGFGDSHGQIHPAPGPERRGWFSGMVCSFFDGGMGLVFDGVMGPVCPRLGRRGHAGSRKGLAFEQSCARPQAGTTHLSADRAVAMVLGVPIALLGTRSARPDTRHEQIADDEEVPLAGSR